jgi:hypothetical protein
MNGAARQHRLSGRPAWVNWLFADRRSGHLVIAQWPNVPLWTFFGAAGLRRLIQLLDLHHPVLDVVSPVLDIIATVALAIWAVLEIASGPNPFRRILGGVVLAGVIVSTAAPLHH